MVAIITSCMVPVAAAGAAVWHPVVSSHTLPRVANVVIGRWDQFAFRLPLLVHLANIRGVRRELPLHEKAQEGQAVLRPCRCSGALSAK